MKEELLAYLNRRIDWHKQEQARLKAENRFDEAAHIQIALNVYGIFLSTCQALQYDLTAALAKFQAISGVWQQNLRKAQEHEDCTKILIENIKLDRAQEIIRYAKELEGRLHD